MVHLINVAALILGLGLIGLLALVPRFGPGSRQLILLLLPASAAAGVQAFGKTLLDLSIPDSIRISYALMILAAAGGYLACKSLNRQAKRTGALISLAVALLLVTLLAVVPPPYSQGFETPEGYVALGPVGYAGALFLLILSVVVLASLEQILRGATETIRWELKFLFLGIGALYAVIIYMSSQTLLFPPAAGLLLSSALSLFHCIFILSCGLIVLAWRRGSGRSRISISHSAIYSSVTLLTVGVYLIASSLIARWAGQWGDIGLPLEALIFILSAIILATLILGTALRHKTRAWIRRNIFAGRYDYRQFWLEATEKVRSIDPLPVAATALADIVYRALGAIDISVWVRRWNPNRLELISSQGTFPDPLEKEVPDVVESLLEATEPLSMEDIQKLETPLPVAAFAEKTRAAFLVPLLSSNRIAGVITVGRDRSSREYDLEAREFLRALAGHAGGEFHKSDLLSTLVAAKEDEAFRAFSTFLLHDLKNFASTLSYIAQNAPKHQHNPEFQKDAFQSVYDTAEKMKRLCNSLKSFSSTPAANKKSIDLNQVVRLVADTLNAGLHKCLTFGFSELPRVEADEEEVARVLQNLLLNAREALADDGTIFIRSFVQDDKVGVSIADNGKGMSREFLEKELFLPFHTTKSGGLGIGLFQCKKIMEAHHGSIQVESKEGAGTTITLMFPKRRTE